MSWSPCPDPELGNRQHADAIDTVVIPRSVDLGGMDVRRALPSKEGRMVGPFIFFDQMGPAELLTGDGIDVEPHPHINLATLTYLFDGEIVHRDSLGSDQLITPGDVNWMKAGRGIVHSERSGESQRQSPQSMFGIQTWVALPESDEESDPDFRHHDDQQLPIIEDDGRRARLIAGDAFGESSPLETSSPTLYAELHLEAGRQLELKPWFPERAIYTLDGRVSIDGCTFPPHQLIVLRRDSHIRLEANDDAHFMLFGGEPMHGPRYIWWNFVSSRRDRIEQAREEWARGAFDTVPGDEQDFLPAPELTGSPRQIVPR
jgi:redox-sensitive bicupin YhaK (pirin superfamily)